MNRTEFRSEDLTLRYLEHGLLMIGLTLLAVFLGFRISGTVGSRLAVWQFSTTTEASREDRTGRAQAPAQKVDSHLWSQKRIEAYRRSLAAKFGTPIALLKSERLSLQTPVFEGTAEPVLNRGVGRISGTAKPGQAGNIGIAGHRDGFFRCLKDIQLGDRLELTTRDQTYRYTVDALRVVNPEDVTVLLPRNRPALTLVTCYPFYFIGSAPRRFIVQASMAEPNSEPGDKATNNHPTKKEVER